MAEQSYDFTDANVCRHVGYIVGMIGAYSDYMGGITGQEMMEYVEAFIRRELREDDHA